MANDENNQIQIDIEEQSLSETNNPLTLQIPQKGFGNFLSGLLGEPTVRSQIRRGAFIISKHDLVIIHQQLIQREREQSQGECISFSTTFHFASGLSVEKTPLKKLKPI